MFYIAVLYYSQDVVIGLNYIMEFLKIMLTEFEQCILISWLLLKYNVSAHSLLPFMGYRPLDKEQKCPLPN